MLPIVREVPPSPLTVWLGSTSYTFAAGRDVTVGRDSGCDIALDYMYTSRTHLVLRFDDTQWTAIDRSRNGIYLDGVRVSTVNIRDGQTIAVADPHRGPRLVFQVGTPAGSSGVAPPAQPPSIQPGQPSELPTGPIPQAAAQPPPAPPRPAGPTTAGVVAHQLGLGVDGRQLIADVSFTASPGTLTAVIGPSRAARSTLLDLLGGAVRPSSGEVTVHGRNVHTEDGRGHVGMAPREDPVHRQLTVEQALGYGAELRLPPDTAADERRRAIARVLDELVLTHHRTIQVRNLTPEERKRASVAMELLTDPSLLVIDEPTAGLEPRHERQAMAMLRRLADTGRTVVVTTSTRSHLDLCDQVVLLTASGTAAFVGPPAQIEAALGATSWSELFTQVGTHATAAQDASVAGRQVSPPETQPPQAAGAHGGLWRQFATAARRQAWLIVGDQRYFLFLTILPFLFAALALAVPGHAGLGPSDPYGDRPDEAVEVLVVLTIAAVFMGTALTIRDLVTERVIFRREQSVGLSASAHLAAKTLVYGFVAIVQAFVLTTLVMSGKGAPTHGAAVLGNAAVELYLAVAATTVVSALVGLALSALAKYKQQLLPMFVLVILVSLVFCGGIAPLADRLGFDQISWLVPARWGFAASASTVDLRAIDLVATDDKLWTHSSGWWVFDMAMLIGLGAVCTGFLRWRLRLPNRTRHVTVEE